MRVYLNVFGGEEIVSDSFNITPCFNDVGGEVKSKLIVVGAVDIDIGNFYSIIF